MASVDARFPLNRLDENHFGPRCIPTSTSSPSSGDHSDLRREQQRRKLLGLHHAAHCTYTGSGPCPGHSHCLAHKRLFSHMMSCREGPKCVIPGCAKGRLIWTHFSTCENKDCQVCSVVPSFSEEQKMSQTPDRLHLPKSPKASISSPARTMNKGRPPLSPKPRFHDLPPRSPPRSPSPKFPN